MEPHIYAELAEQEDSHWWFAARRAITLSLLKRFPLPSHAQILDAGCGSGGNLNFLAAFGETYGFELDNASRARAQKRGIGRVEPGKLPDGIPFDNQLFDLITLFDVLEHVEDDRAALAALAGRLKSGGMLIINVPAFQWLFSQHDVSHHHYRRYGWDELKQQLETAGLEVRLMNYWNALLFPAAAAARLVEKMFPPKQHAMGSGTPPALVNTLLSKMVSAERFLIPRVRLPFGTSIIAVVRKA
jgi:SAM-dependent methyltransferase